MNDVNRLRILQDVIDRRLTTRLAASRLEISDRHCRRLLERYREHGPLSLANLRRGRPGNHRLSESLKLRVLSLLHDNYSDFGPTLAAEKLRERHNITVSVETLRKWMSADGLWVPYSRRKPRVHQPRYRRDCLGELVQIDGSPHDWFEGRAPKCCLLVFVDDATGRLMHLRFGETESAFDYMMATREYLEQHGKPLAFYSDKHGIFRVNNGGSTTTGVTQFGRVLSELGIGLICANSPQAKGRVERANQTLQDRLIKEMRLEGISSIEEANAWLDTFIADFNRRFARPAKYPKDLHRPVAESNDELDDIFAWQEQRKLSKTLTFRYDKMIYLVEPTEENTRIAGEKIKVYDYPDGRLAFKYGYRSLKYQVFDKLECVDQGQIVDNKRLGAVLKLAQSKMDELERDGKRDRSKKMPKRRAQARVQEQLRAINPVLANPEEFRASLKR
ncbi:ISNCY family transposase [Escherichia coli]|uniref:ISNCY family transposase n=1 Tax=Escherichia coli TaxID=562 RepID=UPI0039047205|nr:ISNCY family transposase [Escherichia coli]EGJ6601733.1 ISNCY family transposase [Escherichia coli]EGJ6610727.1 ISNCY family transposase [Escherichia coli]